jgi:excinuclease UvrABC nuclease subunit
MPVSGKSFDFTKDNVDKSPAEPGVYELSEGGTVSYIGMSKSSIRSRLQSHQSGAEGACTKGAKTYKREITASAIAASREDTLLTEYKNSHGGKLPRCNKAS